MKDQVSKEEGNVTRNLFMIICLSNFTLNFDHGILPACTQEMKRDIGIDEFQLGLVGSIVYVGLFLGSVTCGTILDTYSAKVILIVSSIGNLISLVLFSLTHNFILICLSRGLAGFFQIFLVIYSPIWIDSHANKMKTKWMTYLQLAIAIGTFSGYALTAFFVKYLWWRISLYVQVGLFLPCVISFFWFNGDLMSTMNPSIQKDDDDYDNRNHEIMMRPTKRSHLLTLSDDDGDTKAFSRNEVRDHIITQKSQRASLNESLIIQELGEKNKIGFFTGVMILWERKVYIYTMLAASSLFFVITGLQFWISDYMRVVLKQEKERVFMIFGGISITAPITGVISGGRIVNNLGGYTHQSAIDFCLLCGVCACLVGLPIPFLNSLLLVSLLLWLLLFFGGAIMPAIIGIMLTSVPKRLKALGYSNALIIQNLLGYVPAPILYGVVLDLTGGGESRYGMILLMLWTTVGVFTLFAARNARIQKHIDYRARQFLSQGNDEKLTPDLFIPMKQRSSRLDQEFDFISKACVTYGQVRKSRPSSLTHLNMIIGRISLDAQNCEFEDEML